MNSQRTEVGTERTDNADIIGFDPNARKFALWKSDTQRIIHRANPRPLNELQLALTGIPASGTAIEAEVQTDDDVAYEPLVLAAPPKPPPAPTIIKAGYEPLPNGTRLEMCFDVDKQRLRDVGFMETYEPMYDDEGDQLCYKLGAPIWGEAAAGNEWEQDRNKRLVEATSRQA